MREKNSILKKCLVVALFVIALILLVWGLAALSDWFEVQETRDITPESVVKAFRDAGYRVTDVRKVNDHPGPMAIPEYGIRFNLHTSDTIFSVLVVLYDERDKARQSAVQINALDQRMNGGYTYAFYRGAVLVQIFPSDKDMGRELDAVLKAIE